MDANNSMPTPANIRTGRRHQPSLEARYRKYYDEHVIPGLFYDLSRFRGSTSLSVDAKLIEPPFPLPAFSDWLQVTLEAECPAWYISVVPTQVNVQHYGYAVHTTLMNVVWIRLFEHEPSGR